LLGFCWLALVDTVRISDRGMCTSTWRLAFVFLFSCHRLVRLGCCFCFACFLLLFCCFFLCFCYGIVTALQDCVVGPYARHDWVHLMPPWRLL
jgi:hypothetical protein